MEVPARLRVAEILVFAFLGLWLAAAAVLVDIEYYDGFDSVLNARYYTGQDATYEATRGPLMGWILAPAEWLRLKWGLHPLDVRPHHTVMAVLHFGYLLGSYAMLVRLLGRRGIVLAAWVAAVPNFLFFSYAPFISHDILPGIFFLGILVGANSYMIQPRVGLLVCLLLSGTAAVCIKHTYGLFWVCALTVQFGFIWRYPGVPKIENFKRWGSLALAASASMVVMWLALCLSLGTLFPDTPFILRAWVQLKYLLFQAHDRSHPEPAWVYLRNFPAYGILAMLLALPGVWRGLRGNRTQINLAAGWLIAVAALHLLHLRQVRYLSFIAPVTAALIVPVWQTLWSHRWGRRVVTAMMIWSFLPLHPYGILDEAAMINRPFHRHSQLRDLLQHIEKPGEGVRVPLHVNFDKLSFAPPRSPPFAGDIYHDLYHFGLHHLRRFYGLNHSGDMISTTVPAMQAMTDWDENASFLIVNSGPLINSSGWERHETPGKQALQQMVFQPRTLSIRQPEEGLFQLQSGDAVSVSFEGFAGLHGLVMRHPRLVELTEECLVFRVQVPGRLSSFPVLRSDDGTMRVPGLEKETLGDPSAPFSLKIRMLKRVHFHHNANGVSSPGRTPEHPDFIPSTR